MSEKIQPLCRRMEWLDPFYKTVWEKAFSDTIPISGTFELTPRCNFNCRMCYVHLKSEQIPKYGRELTAKEWIRIAQEAKEAGTTWLCVTGGEPLVHPEFETIWRELTQMGFFITLQTNASLIDEKKQKLFEDHPPRGIRITLYGSNDKIYEKVCQVKDGFTKVDAGIKKFKEMKIPIELISTIIRQNEQDIPNMINYALRNKLPWSNSMGIKKSVRGNNFDIHNVQVENHHTEEAFKRALKQRIEKHPISIKRKPCSVCRDYRIGYWITWEGHMRFCSFMDEPRIPVYKLSFQEAWHQLIMYEEMLDCLKNVKNVKCKRDV